MIRVDVGERTVTVHLSGWDAVLALKRTLRLPVDAIEQARAAPWLINARPAGMRLPGSYVPFRPGPVFAGSYLGKGRQWSFWAVRRAAADQLLELRVGDAPDAGCYRTIVLKVDYPGEIASRIEQARSLFASA